MNTSQPPEQDPNKNIEFICRGDPQYEELRGVRNNRFDFSPRVIIRCQSVAHVKQAVQFCREQNLPFRVRSGGHQHEGMSAGDDVAIIDVVQMQAVTIDEKGKTLTLEAGVALGKVKRELKNNWTGYFFPGGGCDGVRIGGLAQGGGWGMGTRKFGLTCDSVKAIHIVLADGSADIASETENPQLFWALKGGGGGNYGVVTQYVFDMQDKEVPPATLITINCHQITREALECYLVESTRLDPEFTSLARITAGVREDAMRFTFQYLGARDVALVKLADLIKQLEACGCDPQVFEVEGDYQDLFQLLNGINPFEHTGNSQLASINAANFVLQPLFFDSANAEKPKIESTCGEQAYPHKITSAFPKAVDEKEFKNQIASICHNIAAFFTSDIQVDTASTYLSIHGLGGAVKRKSSSAFPYRDREFMFQFQAWWENPEDRATEKAALAWIQKGRQSLLPDIEGGFINFPDRYLVPELEQANPESFRMRLLYEYYRDKLPELGKIKARYDADNLFNFEMSIPPMPGLQKIDASHADYDKYRNGKNSRFDVRPEAIFLCTNTEEVAYVLCYCTKHNKPFRIRAGGHHHEGLSSDDNAIIIDLAKMNQVQLSDKRDCDGERIVRIAAGALLQDVYATLKQEEETYYLAGGACRSVGIGGFIHGGGWGFSSRMHGLGSDNIESAEIVLASGEVVTVGKHINGRKDLFAAIKGGGGGNFGIVTRIDMRVFKQPPKVSLLEVSFAREADLYSVISHFMREQNSLPARVTAIAEVGKRAEYPVVLQFKVLGAMTEAYKLIYGFIGHYYGVWRFAEGDYYSSDEITSPDKPDDFSVYCDTARPHKVSSALPKLSTPDTDHIENIAKSVIDFIQNENNNSQLTASGADLNADLFVTIHGLGGNIPQYAEFEEYDFAIYDRNREFMLQFEAWWEDPGDPNQEHYLNWIKNVRASLEENIEGGFMNFVDLDAKKGPTDKDKWECLAIYYGAKKLKKLQEIKARYDAENVFAHTLSIPLPQSVAPE